MQRRWLARGVLILLLIGWVGMLHAFSSQNGEVSGSLSDGFGYRLARLTVPSFDTLPPEEQAQIVEELQTPIRKTAHFLEYALGGVLAAGLLYTFALSPQLHWLWGGAFGLINAIGDECHQLFTPGRSGQVTDVLLDTAGFLCGMLLLFWIRKRRRR